MIPDQKKKRKGARYTIGTDVIVKDDPNYNISGYAVTIQNQGSTMVRLNEVILLPGDDREIVPPADGKVEYRLRVKFIGEYPFNDPLSNYPMLSQGNRLVIEQMDEKD